MKKRTEEACRRLSWLSGRAAKSMLVGLLLLMALNIVHGSDVEPETKIGGLRFEEMKNHHRARELMSSSSSGLREAKPKDLLGETRQFSSHLTILPNSCRCEYPGEGVYTVEDAREKRDDKSKSFGVGGGSSSSSRLSSSASSRYDAESILTQYRRDKSGQFIIPSSHSACGNIIYICFGDKIPQNTKKWTCPAFDLLPPFRNPGGKSKSKRKSFRGGSGIGSRRHLSHSSSNGTKSKSEFSFIFGVANCRGKKRGCTGGSVSAPATWVRLPKNHVQCLPASSPSPSPGVAPPIPTTDGGTFSPTPVPSLEAPTEVPTKSCSGEIVLIDFETDSFGNELEGGTCVTDEWLNEGLTLLATNGCGKTPCLLDSASVRPGKLVLGSPNRECDAPGPGVGKGGLPGADGENCIAQDNILFDDCGGMLVFEFSPAAEQLYEIGLLNVRKAGTTIAVTYANGQTEDLEVPPFGVNSLQAFEINKDDVKQMRITFSEKGAVTFLSYCIEKESTGETSAPTPERDTFVPTQEPETSVPTEEPDTSVPTGEPATSAPTPSLPTDAPPTFAGGTPAPTEEPGTPPPTQDPGTSVPTEEPRTPPPAQDPGTFVPTAEPDKSSPPPTSGGGTLVPSPAPTKSCQTETITFDVDANGAKLPGGAYVQNEWLQFGLTLSCAGKKVFKDIPRLFNTSNPIEGDYGDDDLGSPNRACTPSGPGVGAGGIPGALGENCNPLGNVLICQEDNDDPDIPDDAVGSIITFEFTSDKNEIFEVGLLDASEGTKIIVETFDGTEIKAEIVPVEGLGENANQTVVINRENVVKLKVDMAKSGAVTFISLCYEPEILPPSSAPVDSPSPTTENVSTRPTPAECVEATIDFNSLPDGTILNGGEYLDVQYKPFYGVEFSAAGGLRDIPRLFDTAKVGNVTFGDPDLGSPNKECPGGGPGVGDGGAPGPDGDNLYQNCEYLGNVLIVQEDNGCEEQPDDNQEGGIITMDFSPVAEEVYEIDLLDVDYPLSITIVYINDEGEKEEKPPLPVRRRGNNSLQTVVLDEKNVVQLRLNMRRSGAVTSVTFCYTLQEPAPTTGGSTASPTISPTTKPTRSPPFPASPTKSPPTTGGATVSPTTVPTTKPTRSPPFPASPTKSPRPSKSPTTTPTSAPDPTSRPTTAPSKSPTTSPTSVPDPSSRPTAAPITPSTCEDSYGEYVLCVAKNELSCGVCNPRSPGLKPVNKCEVFADWYESNNGCCENNDCDAELEAFEECKNCGVL